MTNVTLYYYSKEYFYLLISYEKQFLNFSNANVLMMLWLTLPFACVYADLHNPWKGLKPEPIIYINNLSVNNIIYHNEK